MKNFLATLVLCIALLPSVSSAATMQDLEAQKIKLLEQIVVLLTERLEQLLALHSQHMVLGVSTTTVPFASTTATAPVVKKKSGGGGGGSSGGSNPVPLTLTMAGEGNTFTITANKTLDPVSMSATLLTLPSDVIPPLALTLHSKISDGSYQDIELIKSVDSLKYSADLRARLASGLTFSGEFEIIFPYPANVERIFYVVDYDGNGVTRTINLGEYGEAIPVIAASLDNPDSTTLGVYEEEKSDNYTVFAFDIANQGGAPTKVQDVLIDVSLMPDVLITDVISSAILKIGGVSYLGSVTDEGLLFEGLENVIEGRTTKTAELEVVFLPSTEYSAGQKVSFAIDGDSISAVNTDTNIALVVSSDAMGNEHTLVAPGLIVQTVDTQTEMTIVDGMNDDFATYTLELEITAYEQDVYLSTNPATSLVYTLEDGAGVTAITGIQNAILASSAAEVNGYYEISEGETQTIVLEVVYTPGVTTSARLQLLSLEFNKNAAPGSEKTWTANPLYGFRTAIVTIVN